MGGRGNLAAAPTTRSVGWHPTSVPTLLTSTSTPWPSSMASLSHATMRTLPAIEDSDDTYGPVQSHDLDFD